MAVMFSINHTDVIMQGIKCEAPSFTVTMENRFYTCTFSQEDLFPLRILCQVHSLKTHTQSYMFTQSHVYTQGSPSGRGEMGKREGTEEKPTLRKENKR